MIGADYDGPFHFKKLQRDPTGGDYRKVPTVITSGCLVSAAAFQVNGPFREDFFIDSVDDEYCLRLRRKGYAVIESTGFGIVHEIGRLQTFPFLGKLRGTSNHSPTRRYYMARNRLRLLFEYFWQEPAWVLRLIRVQLVQLVFILLVEEDKLLKFKATWLGIGDALQRRLGRFDSRRLGPSANSA